METLYIGPDSLFGACQRRGICDAAAAHTLRNVNATELCNVRHPKRLKYQTTISKQREGLFFYTFLVLAAQTFAPLVL